MSREVADTLDIAIEEIADLTDDAQSSSGDQPAMAKPASWERRRDRLVDRLNLRLMDESPTSPSVFAVLQGLQRAYTQAEVEGPALRVECGCGGEEGFLVAPVGGGTEEGGRRAAAAALAATEMKQERGS